MKSIETSAKTIEDAIRQGLEKLDVSLGDVTIDIIQEGTKGLFGFVGGKDAKVRITVKDSEPDKDDDILSTLTCNIEPEQKAKPAKAKQRQSKPKKAVATAEKQETAAPVAKPAKAPEKAPAKAKEPVKEVTLADPATSAGKAQDFLINVTKLMNLEVSVEADTDTEGNVRVNIHGDTLGILIGRRGETLDALQYLTSLNVNHGKDDYTRVTLDTENYRAKREEALKRLANRMANRAVKTGRKVVMEPMNPYERRILHSALQQNEAVTTHSEGDEPNRHVVISLK
ncbi:MAG TPA: RNA-binding cell elongation regulator Jag/EloR [Candidatus Limiplasma sp.]|nr:RNA-binding cell elongation regulator Jag/EloR [Candidatus Limiplasma sp.]